MFRFIHSSDLHLGKRFGNFSGDLPGRLREARHGVIARLAQHAREQGADTILLAGDTFDTETPAPDVRRQALAEMRHHAPLRWVILPGNHDSLQAAQLWATLKAEAPANVFLATEPRPLALAPQVTLLPAPCTTRRPGRDLTEWMDAQTTPEGTVRLGLAHGAIRSFSEDAVGGDVIAPDRARRAGLAYLALGDWHGAVEVDSRTRYSGTPEPDRFKHERPGEALLVRLAGMDALPEVTALPTASFAWRSLDLHLLEGDDPLPVLKALLPEVRTRRQTLARVVATGRTRLAGHAALAAAVAEATPDFAVLELDDAALATACETDDLDRIDRAGALREAANALLAEANDASRSAAEREVAGAALARLYSYAQQSSTNAVAS
ncbi:DNA repair exonuclease SbcCD nuclease subunit [Ancylobacter aquaticus]|uniref:DNA repair exonuclease SbcCD nuclease subunit n=1 Tax=Ancylobacter aquaticus TaxID=100 RepID=A0A4R1I340_ANCAQ|nr:DNA repair exonuclease [Ancylobacter aquaticus]TCK28373.1 DNA repair exonuclease SbcCD nuclease subunit [Ancylobacter aquaticus]